ncbi:RNA polymerase sigma-70 factor [Flavobacteriaceae bacterium F08102]|nr:RNA polymerase sigma-70 factor [Flavobacteriaceae bacterium F08102]
MSKNFTDKELLKQIELNNSNAFKLLHDKYASNMFLYAFKVLKDKQVSEDIIQNIFIDFWSKRNNNNVDNIKSYFFRAVKYQIFNHFRNHKLSTEDITRLNLIDISINASKRMEYQELEEIIHNSINKLPKRCKEIFELSRFEQKSNKEIAEELGISVQGVKNQISKALKHIRKDLQKDEHLFYFLCFNTCVDYLV